MYNFHLWSGPLLYLHQCVCTSAAGEGRKVLPRLNWANISHIYIFIYAYMHCPTLVAQYSPQKKVVASQDGED